MVDKQFSNKEILELKSIIENKQIIEREELEEIKELKKGITSKSINLAILYSKCFNILSLNYFKLKDNSKDFSDKIDKFLDENDVSEIRYMVNDYNYGNSYGDHIIEENIKRQLSFNKDKCNRLIRLFINIFLSEDI